MSQQGEGGLPVPDDMTTQHREWRFERIGWGVMLLIVLAAGVGLLGPGWLSHTRAASRDQTAVVEYEQHLRKSAPAELRVELLPQALTGDEVRLSLDNDYLKPMNLVRIVPEPVRAEVAAETTEFVFQLSEARHSGGVTFSFEPREPGLVTGAFRVNRRSLVPLRHVVFP